VGRERRPEHPVAHPGAHPQPLLRVVTEPDEARLLVPEHPPQLRAGPLPCHRSHRAHGHLLPVARPPFRRARRVALSEGARARPIMERETAGPGGIVLRPMIGAAVADYRFIDHTGDFGLELEADDLADVFAGVARAFADLLTDGPDLVAAREPRELAVS